jgi:hypothetical protein
MDKYEQTDNLKEELGRKRLEYMNKNVLQLQEEKFKCEICTKMFKGCHYVRNHILNKHIDLVNDYVDKEVR